MLLTPQENIQYLERVYQRLLEHRYRYYVLNEAAISDFEHDWIEKYYNEQATVAGLRQMEMVDFDFKDIEAVQAGKRVDAGLDGHSLWLATMFPVWKVIGIPRSKKKEVKAKREQQI